MKRNEKGFTLVELAIALMVIGLLIGGVLKGQELIQNARVTATMRNIKAYDAAVMIFRSTYRALPGDLRNAGTRLPNCTGASCAGSSLSPDGNGIIGDALPNIASNFSGSMLPRDTENRKFFLHMAVAGLITGVDPSGPQTDGPCGTHCGRYGETWPTVPMHEGGGVTIAYYSQTAATESYPLMNGHYYGISSNPVSPWYGTVHSGLAAQLDSKMDDGKPKSGDVLGRGQAASGSCVASDAYDVTGSVAECALLIRTGF